MTSCWLLEQVGLGAVSVVAFFALVYAAWWIDFELQKRCSRSADKSE